MSGTTGDCGGTWEAANNCRECPRCASTEAAHLRRLIGDVFRALAAVERARAAGEDYTQTDAFDRLSSAVGRLKKERT